ncbi:protein translocase subunit SecF [Lyticum sinuosum]|uniref:Protein-export membrane protein SecF n=1 Tax=Lyticum sinuosum TaxID=1332059 RepID=A0AAE4VKY2_9RICK|nr:protein translocase subunit SecF [Lyticum sinuosum]MDZ5761378.1 Protein-export membrane protein SecF [Lyticum sinuosum]
MNNNHISNKHYYINFTKYIPFFCIFSCIITIYSIFCLINKGLNLGIDFSGGSLIEVSAYSDNIKNDIDFIRHKLNNIYPNSIIQYSQINNDTKRLNSDFLDKKLQQYNITLRIHSKSSKEDDISQIIKLLSGIYNISKTSVLLESSDKELNNKDYILRKQAEINRFDYVGPKAESDFFINALKSLLIAILVILIYIWFRFEWRFSVGVVVSLLHDIFITLGFYSVTGYDFDLTSIAAILTIIGYSVNDSVVIYDRIRENKNKLINKSQEIIINTSLNETLSRTIMTVGTTLAVCLSLIVYGGNVLHGFGSAIFFGIAFGTYSSVYISTAVLMPKKYFFNNLLNNNLFKYNKKL